MRKWLILVILAVLSVCDIQSHTWCWNKTRGFETFSSLFSPDGKLRNEDSSPLDVIFRPDPGNLTPLNIEFRFKVENNTCNPNRRYAYRNKDEKKRSVKMPYWGIILMDEYGKSLKFYFKTGEGNDGLNEIPVLLISSWYNSGENDEFIRELEVNRGVDVTGSKNIFRVNYSASGVILSGGLHRVEPLITQELPEGFEPVSIGFRLMPGAELSIDEMRLSYQSAPEPAEMSPWTDSQLLKEYLEQTPDPIEGYWQILDRTLEESLLRKGGDYKFAIVRALDGYDLIYLEGAMVNADAWHPGMIKAHLSPTGVEGIWNVEWTDSEFRTLKYEVKAQLEEGPTIRIQFPYQSSILRLIKTG